MPLTPKLQQAYSGEKDVGIGPKAWQDNPFTILQQETAKDTPLMQQARTRAAQQASKRGLLNTSMSVGAGQLAAYNAATPLATQQAGQSFQKNLSRQGYQQTGGLAEQAAANQQAAAEAGYGYQAKLAEQQTEAQKAAAESGFVYQTQLATQQTEAQKAAAESGFVYQTQLATQQTEAQKAAAKGAFQYQTALTEQELGAQKERLTLDLSAQMDRLALDTESKLAIQNMAVDVAAKGSIASTFAGLSGAYSTQVANITNNTSIPAATRTQLILDARRIRDADIKALENLYSIDLSWATPTYTPPTYTPLSNTATTGSAKTKTSDVSRWATSDDEILYRGTTVYGDGLDDL